MQGPAQGGPPPAGAPGGYGQDPYAQQPPAAPPPPGYGGDPYAQQPPPAGPPPGYGGDPHAPQHPPFAPGMAPPDGQGPADPFGSTHGGPPPGPPGGGAFGGQPQGPAGGGSPANPPALADMKIAGSEAFEATAFSPDPQQGNLPPTGAMSPYPGGPAPGAPPPAPPQPGSPAPGPYGPPAMGAYGPPVGQVHPHAMDAPQPQGAPAHAPAPAQDALADTRKAPSGSRELRGFLFSFHANPNGDFWPLFAGENAIGRADSGEPLDIPIADPTTSSRHAVLISDGPSKLTLQDAGSTNGSFVNDQPVGYQGSVELHDGDRIRLGGYNAAVRFVAR